MKISFDFDGTLTEYAIKETARTFIQSGHDVWVVTARADCNYNADLWGVCKYIGLPKDKVIFTNGDLKFYEYEKGNFELHYDDEWDEVLNINRVGGTAILVNPDFQDIYMNMQFEENERNKETQNR